MTSTLVQKISDSGKLFRMAQWIFTALAFYAISIYCTRANILPQVQTISFKAGNVTAFAYIGFWVAKHAFLHAEPEAGTELPWLPIAIVMAAVIIGGSLGL